MNSHRGRMGTSNNQLTIFLLSARILQIKQKWTIMNMLKLFNLFLMGLFIVGCGTTSDKDLDSHTEPVHKKEVQKSNSITIEESRINHLKISQRSKWKNEDWYRAKDGDWFGNYLNWFRHTMQISSDNSIGILFGNPLYPSFVLESYKKALTKKNKIERILHLTILANKKSINSISIQFDNGKWELFKTTTKHNIEVHFSKKDTDIIINKLKNAETFAIKVSTNTLYFNNKNFKKYFK